MSELLEGNKAREETTMDKIMELGEFFERQAQDASFFNDDAAKARSRAFQQAAQMLRDVIGEDNG